MALKELPKIGDKVRYVGGTYSFMTVGKIYDVVDVIENEFYYRADDGTTLAEGADDFEDWELVESDAVNSPQHYTQGDIEVIDYIDQVASGYEGKQAYYVGNIVKYVSRAPYKNGLEDVRKCAWYIQRLIDAMEAESSE